MKEGEGRDWVLEEELVKKLVKIQLKTDVALSKAIVPWIEKK